VSSAFPISRWAEAFEKLYGAPDRVRAPEEIWIATMAHCASIGESIRKADFVELMEYAPRAFGWMISLSARLRETDDLLFRCDNTFCQCVYFKFPDCCGHCTHDVCDCKPLDMDAKKDKSAKYKTLLEKWDRHNHDASIVNYTIDQWLDVFRGIYAGRIHLQTMETLGFHFLEEAGEEASAIRELMQLRGVLDQDDVGITEADLNGLVTIPQIADEYIKLGANAVDGKPPIDLTARDRANIYARIVSAKMNLIVELADTFSFFCSILIKLSHLTISKAKNQKTGEETPVYFGADLEEALVALYGDPVAGLRCPVCRQPACTCVFFPKSAVRLEPA
jgi:hypothetical protein